LLLWGAISEEAATDLFHPASPQECAVSFDFKAQGDVAILAPKGMLLGGRETDDLRVKIRQLVEEGNRRLIFDLGKLTFMSSQGVGLLMETYVSHSKRGGEVRLCAVDPKIKQLFVILRLNLIFGDADFATVEEAIASFTDGGSGARHGA
jgi:anti-sigma B factor antagonist